MLRISDLRFGCIGALLLWILLFIGVHKACAQTDRVPVLYRGLQLNALSAPLADAVTTLHNNHRAGLRETNWIYARSDGSASPIRLVLVKSVSAGSSLYLLKVARRQSVSWKRYSLYTLVGVANAREWYAAQHNYRLGRK